MSNASSRDGKCEVNLKSWWNDRKSREMALKFARSGDLSNLRLLIDLGNYEEAEFTSRVSNTKVLSRNLVSVVDDRQRNLLHLAAKSGRRKMIAYLVGLGFPTDKLDKSGNSATLLLLRRMKKRVDRAKRRGGHNRDEKPSRSINYIRCCQLLQLLLTNSPHLLTTANKRGLKPTDILQHLWVRASDTEKTLGDEILMTSLTNTEDLRQAGSSSAREDPSEEFFAGVSDGHWGGDSMDSDDAYAWEDYFCDFSTEEYRSHLDTISEEYEHRRQARYEPPRKAPKADSLPSSSQRNSQEFHARHAAALRRKLGEQPNTNISVTFEAYRMKWKEFLEASSPITEVNDVPWPPFCGRFASSDRHHTAELRIETVLKFVHYSASDLRQLQIDWHPDRFFAKLSTRIFDSIKETLLTRVNAISQLLNTSTDTLRRKNVQ
ncbi:unnamed protein product [Calicophoron daubneyi]|uniref:NF-kappa-B inhibitor-like protein 1 n=1 Tax=Calicophoron daubneyi TaxID=300641 RepID=A0AAV2TAR0_CALDB